MLGLFRWFAGLPDVAVSWLCRLFQAVIRAVAVIPALPSDPHITMQQVSERKSIRRCVASCNQAGDGDG